MKRGINTPHDGLTLTPGRKTDVGGEPAGARRCW
jgi:hypothetical protein